MTSFPNIVGYDADSSDDWSDSSSETSEERSLESRDTSTTASLPGLVATSEENSLDSRDSLAQSKSQNIAGPSCLRVKLRRLTSSSSSRSSTPSSRRCLLTTRLSTRSSTPSSRPSLFELDLNKPDGTSSSSLLSSSSSSEKSDDEESNSSAEEGFVEECDDAQQSLADVGEEHDQEQPTADLDQGQPATHVAKAQKKG